MGTTHAARRTLETALVPSATAERRVRVRRTQGRGASGVEARGDPEPRLLLSDEPTENLDSNAAGEVMELLRSLNGEGTTICMVTHDPHHAASANRTISMLDGRILETGLHATS